MSDKLDDTQDLGSTQPLPPPTPPNWTPPPGHVQEPLKRGDPRKAKPPRAQDRRNSALYLPIWSVGLMLLLVFGITASIVMLVITLGGGRAPGGEPRVLIITAQPSEPAPSSNDTEPTAASAPVQSFGDGAVPTFALEGPTLPPVVLSPTPISITLGATVIVNSESLRIRPQPSLDNTELFFADEGDRFTVVGGPEQGSGLTWWQVQDENDSSRTGWAAADYLDVAVQ